MKPNISKGLKILELIYTKNPNNIDLATQLIEYYSQFYELNQAIEKIKELEYHENLLSHPKLTAWKFSEAINLPNFDSSSSIPKSIYQINLGKNNLAPKIEKNIQIIKDLNPTYAYFLFDDKDAENLLKEYYTNEIIEIYNKINPIYGAAKADFLRYLLIYAKGGIYLDLKSTITKPLDEALNLNTTMYLSSGPKEYQNTHKELERFHEGEYQQWHIVAAAGHPLLRRVIKRVIYNIQHYSVKDFGVGRRGVLRTTGPIAFTLAISDDKNELFKKVDVSKLGFDYTIFKNPHEHKSLVKNHYAKLKEPVVL